MTPEDLSALTVAALRSLVDRGDVRLADGVPATVTVERPRQSGHGDYATNAALQLAKPSGLRPRDLAELLRSELLSADQVAAVEVAGPGFLNVTVESSAQARVAADIVAAGDRYGDSDLLAGQRINLEFVSANPTGPLHLGGARWAAVGDALARILVAAGGEVTREYYFNDHGAQIDRFARSLYAAANGLPAPEDGYAGDYITEIADRVVAAHPEIGDLDESDAVEILRADGVALMFDEIKADLRAFGVEFDVYFHEESLHRSGAVQRAIDRLTELGSTYRRDDALWLRTEQHGDDKDRVIVRSDGTGAYLSGDLAYYLDKRERGYDRCLILLGADHHGYVGRMMAMCAAFGDEPGVNLQILIGQMVNLLREGRPAKLSKRSGTVVTQAGLVAAIGVDAARYALTRYSMDTTIDLDLDLWSRQHQDNPVYYVQYAHARVCSLLRNAADLGLAPATGADFDASLLTEAAEGDLLRSLAELPTVVSAAARLREPHRVARYLEETAAAYHRFYDRCRVLPQGDEEPSMLHGARLTLVEATRIVLSRGLDLLGVTAPERM